MVTLGTKSEDHCFMGILDPTSMLRHWSDYKIQVDSGETSRQETHVKKEKSTQRKTLQEDRESFQINVFSIIVATC